MVQRDAFTLIELLVVIAIIALLMAILMPSLQRTKKQAKSVACQMNLHQWGIIWSMYTGDNDGYFHQGPGGFRDERWPNSIRSYYSSEPKIRCCPTATKPRSEGNIGTFSAWGIFTGSTPWGKEGDYGSYGVNWWVCNTPSRPGGNYYPGTNSLVNNWRRANVKGAGYIPLYLDAGHYGFWPFQTDEPPEYDGQLHGVGHVDEMRTCCLNRHNAFVNSLFLDWSFRKVGLKELWKLKWHRNYKAVNSWTKAGGVRPEDWPEWMRPFRDY